MIGHALGHYRITSRLGVGRWGEVWRALDTRSGREVALKALPPEMGADESLQTRFRRDTQALLSLDHPSIVPVYSVENSRGIHFLTMGLVNGQPLDRLIPDDGMPLRQILDIAIPLADALAAAHEKGVVHGDLRPSNVMVTPEGGVKVLDFALAVSSRGSKEAATSHAGRGDDAEHTLRTSPEQADGRPADTRSDVFAS